MNILGIETSCDETAAAVVRKGTRVLSNIVASSIGEHAPYGGIIPEIASRRQLEFISTVVGRSLSKARIGLNKVDAVAVTGSPGLIGSLLVGTAFARALSFALQKPLIVVDHIKAHVYANFLEFPDIVATAPQDRQQKPSLPAIALVVSGGHTNLYHVTGFNRFRLLGQTLDDAAGEAFDKVARILDLGYPGGPVIDRLANASGPTSLRFRCAPLPETYNFSFSGIKTAVFYHHRNKRTRDQFSVGDVAYAFQTSIINVLTRKCMDACWKLKIKNLLIGGGVAANSALRHQLGRAAHDHNVAVYFPPFCGCTDNAAMIAGLGYHLFRLRHQLRQTKRRSRHAAVAR